VKCSTQGQILTINEFDFPFPRYDLLPREGVIILKLQGFGVVSIIGLNPNLIKVGDLVLLVTHIGMYMRVQVWLKIGHGVGIWITVDRHHYIYYFFLFLSKPLTIEVFEKVD